VTAIYAYITSLLTLSGDFYSFEARNVLKYLKISKLTKKTSAFCFQNKIRNARFVILISQECRSVNEGQLQLKYASPKSDM
jgi:hypothetical protein